MGIARAPIERCSVGALGMGFVATLLRSKHTVFPSADSILEFLWDGCPIIDEGIFDEIHSHKRFPYKEEIFDILMAFLGIRCLTPSKIFGHLNRLVP